MIKLSVNNDHNNPCIVTSYSRSQEYCLLPVFSHCSYDTTQRQLDVRMQAAGSAPEGDISMGMRVPAEFFSVSSKAFL